MNPVVKYILITLSLVFAARRLWEAWRQFKRRPEAGVSAPEGQTTRMAGSDNALSPQKAAVARRPDFKLRCLEYKALFVSPDYNQGVIEPTTERQESHSVMGLTLSFTNDANEDRFERSVNVVSEIRFYSDDWSKSVDIANGVWLNSPCSSTTMEIGGIGELVLIMAKRPDYCAIKDLRLDINKQYRQYFTLEDVSWFSHVRVKLTDQISDTSTVISLRVWHDPGAWCHALVQPPQAVEDVPW
jgi:hypothetical protein